MTQREEVRFKVYTKASVDVFGSNTIFPLELIDFLEGDGTYDTTTYKYTVQNAGTYLLGISFNKRGNPNNGVVDMLVDRIIDGNTRTIDLNRIQENKTGTYLTMNFCIMYRLEVGDILYCNSPFGRPLTNLNAYTTDDTLNSFWGIRLDY